jgi:hypothetical protein
VRNLSSKSLETGEKGEKEVSFFSYTSVKNKQIIECIAITGFIEIGVKGIYILTA